MELSPNLLVDYDISSPLWQSSNRTKRSPDVSPESILLTFIEKELTIEELPYLEDIGKFHFCSMATVLETMQNKFPQRAFDRNLLKQFIKKIKDRQYGPDHLIFKSRMQCLENSFNMVIVQHNL